MMVDHILFGHHRTEGELPIKISLNPFTSGNGDYILLLVMDETGLNDREYQIKGPDGYIEKKILGRTVGLRETVAKPKRDLKRR